MSNINSLPKNNNIQVLVSVKKNANKDFENLLAKLKIKIINFYNSVNVYSIGLTPSKLQKLIKSSEVLFVRWIYDIKKSPESIVRAFEYLLIRNDKSVRVVNLSLGLPREESQNLSEFDPVKLSIKNAGKKGILVVVAAGNYGPEYNSLNPWSLRPNVISVGATDENKVLMESSSRGNPQDLHFTPTIVSNGKNPLGIPPGYDYVPVSTSFATANISHVACLCIRFVHMLETCMKGKVQDEPEIRIAFMDTGLNPTELSKVSPPLQVLTKNTLHIRRIHSILKKLTKELKIKNAKYVLDSSPKTIKKIIVKMAKPLANNNQPFESGAGFVFWKEPYDYLKSFGAKSFFEVFSDMNFSSEIRKITTKFDRQYGPFFTDLDINYLFVLSEIKEHPAFQVHIKVINGY
jgi:subtilisin family serine protease